jgi:hypothetical protein
MLIELASARPNPPSVLVESALSAGAKGMLLKKHVVILHQGGYSGFSKLFETLVRNGFTDCFRFSLPLGIIDH